ncbi:protease complex subunit PrcB family protein [Neobacillus sp. PS3-34]|uniref:protease complex subunit PrcB family protein n=1 Tax=Neobacillus sp. PS3-34 TaxID=3070678 RepID=UPI0027E187B8|nr:protease complex subunit PrcB family protein [Neobacillus sp. PS3-34]WML50024.1 protease complex subunit PrcB family protein [Neobacillus sp. PS3-34]
MKKFGIALFSSVLLMSAGSSVFAEGEKVIAIKELLTLQFQQVDVANLSDVEKSFVNIAKEHKGIHRLGSLYVIALGPKPNTGYGIRLEKQEQTFEQLKIHVKLLEPEQGKAYGQVITYPYIVGKVDLPQYTTLSVLDVDSKKPIFDENHFKLFFKEKRITADTRRNWAIYTGKKLTQADLATYKITIKQLGDEGKELPVTLTIDKKNSSKIIVKPNEPYKKGALYLLQTVNMGKNDTAMTVTPFEVK